MDVWKNCGYAAAKRWCAAQQTGADDQKADQGAPVTRGPSGPRREVMGVWRCEEAIPDRPPAEIISDLAWRMRGFESRRRRTEITNCGQCAPVVR